MTKYLTLEEVLLLHHKVIEDFGGIHGVRDESRLLSVEHAPKQNAFGQEQYSSIHQKAAVYLKNIIRDHPFADGNKRTAVTCCGIFLLRNSVALTASPKDLEDFAVKIAVDKLSVETITTWLKKHSANM